jgi:hypothetical protein
MPQRLPLTLLPTALAEGGWEAVPYRRAYEAARSCEIPAQRDRNGRWTFDPQDLPRIAESFRLSSVVAA